MGARYLYRVNGQSGFPDPYSKSQPEGVHKASEVVDLTAHTWHDTGWTGLEMKGLVIYECHVGTATTDGTFEALIGRLDYLKELGVTALELMPVAEASGTRGWGYDGVYPFAPSRNYGGPLALQRLVDAAHQHGLGVLLDVVYNHLGPEGNYLAQFSSGYFTDRYETPWGQAINFDGPDKEWPRKFFTDNAAAWIRDYHLDGLRLDATFEMHDGSARHILQDLTEAAQAAVETERGIVLIAENSENDVRYMTPVKGGGYGFDAVWADDFHHELQRYLNGDHEGYYQDYQGTLAELAETINHGFLYEGQRSPYAGGPRGTSARDNPAWQFQYCIQNHDQVGNRAFGDRLNHYIDLDRYRAASALLLLLPYTPLLFSGQEFAASSPFLFFSDHSDELGRLVTEGRRKEFSAYAAFGHAEIPDPQDVSTFLRSKINYSESERPPGRGVFLMYQELLRLRREDPVLRLQDRFGVQASGLTESLLAVRLAADRVVIANFGDAVRPSLAGGKYAVRQQPAHLWRERLAGHAPPRAAKHSAAHNGSGGVAAHYSALKILASEMRNNAIVRRREETTLWPAPRNRLMAWKPALPSRTSSPSCGTTTSACDFRSSRQSRTATFTNY